MDATNQGGEGKSESSNIVAHASPVDNSADAKRPIRDGTEHDVRSVCITSATPCNSTPLRNIQGIVAVFHQRDGKEEHEDDDCDPRHDYFPPPFHAAEDTDSTLYEFR